MRHPHLPPFTLGWILASQRRCYNWLYWRSIMTARRVYLTVHLAVARAERVNMPPAKFVIANTVLHKHQA